MYAKPAGLLHLLLYESLLIVSNVLPQGSLMPRGDPLALRMKAKGIIGEFEGARLRSSVLPGHEAPLPGHVGWFNWFLYRDALRLSWPKRGRKRLDCKMPGGEGFVKSKCRAPGFAGGPVDITLGRFYRLLYKSKRRCPGAFKCFGFAGFVQCANSGPGRPDEWIVILEFSGV
jgi:hypothetical protein